MLGGEGQWPVNVLKNALHFHTGVVKNQHFHKVLFWEGGKEGVTKGVRF